MTTKKKKKMMMMIIAKRWTNELTFSFVTQGVHGTPCLGEPSSVRRCAVPLRPRALSAVFFGRKPPAFVCHGDCHQPHHLDAHLHFRGLFRLFEVVHSTPSQAVRPGSSILKVQPNDFGPCSRNIRTTGCLLSSTHCRAVIIKLFRSGLLAGKQSRLQNL